VTKGTVLWFLGIEMLLSHQNNLFEIITSSFCSIICMIQV
jgi:hypothetical protein